MSTKEPIQVFDFKQQQLRTIIKKNNISWFMVKDVCKILDLKNPTVVISALDPDEKEKIAFFNPKSDLGFKGIPKNPAWFISESGLYHCLMRSDKPQAKEFQRWLRKTVLPQIMRTGEYRKPCPGLPNHHWEKLSFAIVERLSREITSLTSKEQDFLLTRVYLRDFFDDLQKHLVNLSELLDGVEKENPAAVFIYEGIIKHLNDRTLLEKYVKRLKA